MADIFQITLKDVRVIENGQIKEDVVGVNSLAATLYYPSENKPAIMTVRSLELKENESLDYTKEDFKKQLVFKEIIRGDSVLEVEITAIDKASKFEKAIRKLLGVAAGGLAGAIPGVGTIVTAVATSATESVFELADPKDKITTIGKGVRGIDENTPEGDFVINLAVPEEITLKQRKFDNEGKEVIQTKILEKGFVNAKVVFHIKRIVFN